MKLVKIGKKDEVISMITSKTYGNTNLTDFEKAIRITIHFESIGKLDVCSFRLIFQYFTYSKFDRYK